MALVLNIKIGDVVYIGNKVKIQVRSKVGKVVSLAFICPKEIRIYTESFLEKHPELRTEDLDASWNQ